MKWYYVVILFWGITLTSCIEAQNISPLFPCTEKMEDAYGVCAHLTRKDWDWEIHKEEILHIKQAGAQFVRADWDYRKVDENSIYGWLDSVMETMKTNKVQMLGILSTPWKSYPWKDIRSYHDFINYNLKHFDGRVNNWEVLNEINLISSNDSLPLLYTKLLKEVYPEIKEINPGNKVLLSGLCETTDGFLEKICRYEAYKYFDIVNFHSYYLPEDLKIHFEIIRKCMDKYGWEKPVWISELGMHTCREKDSWRTEDAQARIVARYHLIAFAYGVDKVFWYNFRSFEKDDKDPESHFGLTHKDLSPKPAYLAYQTMTKMCPSGSTRPTLIKKGDIYLSGWICPNKQFVWAIWKAKGSSDIKLNIRGKCVLKDYMGATVKRTNKTTIRVSSGVTYIIGAKRVEFTY